jgi:hypothetical protein
MKAWHWVLIAVAAIALMAGGTAAVVTAVKKGKAIGGPDAYPDANHKVPGDPKKLAAEAGYSLDIYSLARAITSEAGSLPQIGQIGVAWAVKNKAKRAKVSITKQLIPSGSYGGQGFVNPWAATTQPPTADSLELARKVEKGEISDPTGGAVGWDSPDAQLAMLKKYPEKYTKTPEQVAENRRKEGMVEVVLPGLSRNKTRFWRYA